MARLFRYFQGDPVVTSSPTEVRMWVEELDYSFLAYGEIFESAEINGEKLLNITRKQLNELGIVQAEHQDILLKAVYRIRQKGKVEEQVMSKEDQNIRKMPTRFGKESEQLERAIDRVFVTISERRLARSLHGTSEQPPHRVLTATLDLVNIASKILNILERPPFDCMSEFSSLKNHLIKHITLLKHYSEQADLSHENESHIIDVCKDVNKMCRYIIALPPDLPKPEIQVPGSVLLEERPPRVQVPITTEPKAMSSSVKRKADCSLLSHHLSMPITTTVLSYGPPIQYTSLPSQRVSESYSFSQRVDTPSDEGGVILEHDKGSKSETEISDTNASETLGGFFYYKTFQDLTIIESDTPLMDSGSERCMIDSDSDRGVVSDFELEQYSDSEKSPRDSDSRKHLIKAENDQMESVSIEDLTKTGQQLVRIEQCQVESGSLTQWVPSGSIKLLEDSDSARDSDSDNERKKEEKRQMASDSIKRLLASEKTMMDTESFWMIPDSESYVVDLSTEKGRASISKVHLIEVENTERRRSKRYMEDSDSETSETDLDSERHELASAALKYFMDTKTSRNKFPKDSWSERRTLNSDSDSPVMSSDSAKHMKKAETCKSTCNLERLKVAHKSESLQEWLDAKRKQLDSCHSGHWDSSGKYQFKSIVPQYSIGKCQGDLQTFQSVTEKDNVDSSSEKYQKKTGNESDQRDPESKRHPIKREKGFDNKRSQMDKEREGHLMASDCRDSENEAHRLGARRKENRPPGFWRPVTLTPKLGQEKKNEEHKSVHQKDNRFCRTQLTSYKSEDKTVRLKEASSSLSDKQLSQEKIKEKLSYSFSPDSHTFTDEKYHRKASQKISVYKRHCREYRYAHGYENFRYQITPIPPSSESSTSNVSSRVGSPNSKSLKSATRQKTRRSITFSLDVETKKCARCFMEISNSSFHKCPTNSDDSDSDSPLHSQISSDSKYSLRAKTVKHFKTARHSPLSRSLDPKHRVGIRCSLHREYFRHSVDSTSYLHCESCSALRNLKSSGTNTLPIKSEKIMGQYSTYSHKMSTPVRLSESESKFNLIAQPQNKDNPDESLIKIISARNIKDETDVEEELLSKDETDQEYETNTEDEADAEDETDTEDEDNNKDKKDPKDKSDPDGSDPKDGNSENNTDSNTGSDPSGASGPTNGPDSSNDGDSKNVTDHNNESYPAIDNASNSDVNLKYSTDLDSASDLAEDFNQQNNVDTKGSTNPNSASGNKNRTMLDYISLSKNDVVVPRNDTGQGNNICSENIIPNSNSLDYTKNKTDANNNSSPSNSHGLLQDLEFNYTTNFSDATGHNVVNPNRIFDPTYGTESTSTAIHKHTTALKYYSDLTGVTGFTYKVRSSFLINPNYFVRKKYATRPRFTLSVINANDTSNITSCTNAINSQFTAGKNYAPENKHFPRFSHFNCFNIIVKNIQNAHNSPSTNNINTVSDTELKTSSISSIFKIVYGTNSNFIADTDHTSYSDVLITSEFHDPLELCRAYIIFDNQNIGAQFQHSTGYKYSDTSKYATGSVDALDAKESGFLRGFSRVQNPIGIKDPSPFDILSNQNIPLPGFDVTVEAELPDVVKFAISSGAVNQLFKLLGNYNSASRGEGRSLAVPMREITRRSEVPVRRSAERPAWRPERGRPVRLERGYAVKPARDHAMMPAQRVAMIPARGRSMSPARRYSERRGREHAESRARRYSNRQARSRTVSPFRMHPVSSAQQTALQQARRRRMRHEEEFLLGAAVGLTVKSAEGYDEETFRSARLSTQFPSDDDDENESGSSLLMDLLNCFMKAKAQNWIDSSWFRHLLTTFFSEENRRSWFRTRFCSIACTDIGHGSYEGWIWHKRESRGISFFSWKKCWFILKHATLYWFSHLNDTKADGFIYLPEFRIDLAPHCRREHAFQASHARIKDFYFACTCFDEMNFWLYQIVQLAFGSSFGDAAANEEYRRASSMIYAKCVKSLKRDFPVIWCNNCQEATTIVSMNPTFQHRCSQIISDEFIYFRPNSAENRERARKQKQQNPTLTSQQPTREGIPQRDLGLTNQEAMVTTPPLTKELDSIALVKPKTSGLLRIEKVPIKSRGVPELKRLDVTGIASPNERGNGTAIYVAGVPGKEELDDTEIPTLHFTGFVHLENLINECSPSSEYSRPATPRNLWMESPDNAESPGSDDLEVARSMYPFRERPIFRRSWAELLEAPLNSEGLHILQTTPKEENRDMGCNKLTSEEENQVTIRPQDQHFQALQGPFPLLPERPKLQRQRSRSLPRYSEIRGQYVNVPGFKLDAEEIHFFSHDRNLLTEENIKKRYKVEEAWKRAIPSPSGEHLPIEPRFEDPAIRGNIAIPKDNSARPRGNVRVPKNDVNTIPMVNVGMPMDNPQVPRGQGNSVGILPNSKYMYPNYTFWNWEKNHKMNSGIH
ncbi:uncharacterized protein LOC101831433 isoform X2 [Mesocricetus auratus]|uniref:Uncharacterized protein LOC101831433 isoform X2 n=1 Tax=Mesocricetus auratus TaxID=10036 RepID=A0ABM2XBT9_MESAU|nr:uncharacterized protein LOC101831433 isoform X2 [Mesocricetus auratus]